MKTKLVHCGKTIWLYECNARYPHKQLEFEKKENQYGYLDIKRLIYTNFISKSDDLVQVMTLSVENTDLAAIKNKLLNFVARLERLVKQKLDYLAITTLEESKGNIYFIFNIDIGLLPLDEDIPWDGDVFINLMSVNMLLKDTVKVLEKIEGSTYHFFKSKLNKPIIKLDEEAEEYLKQFDIINQKLKSVSNIHDSIGGYTRVYEYFLETPL